MSTQSLTVPEQVAKLHADYGRITGRAESLRFCEREWFELLRAPEYKGDAAALGRDVEVVVRYLRRMIAETKRHPGALKLRNFLQPENFLADLAEAKASKPSQAHSWGSSKPQEPAAPISEDERQRLADAAKKQREELGKKLGRPA